MRAVIGWIVIVAAVLLIVGLIGWARGPEHHHGDDVGAIRPVSGPAYASTRA